jgi:putative DNA methylase
MRSLRSLAANSLRVRFEVVEAHSENGLGFDPAAFSKAGNATCPFCGTVADSNYVKAEGCAGRMSQQLMAIVCTRPGRQGKVYLPADPQDRSNQAGPLGDAALRARIAQLCQQTGLTVPNEPIVTDAKNSCWTHLYGLKTFGDLFTPWQIFCLLSFASAVRKALDPISGEPERKKAVGVYLAVLVNRQADYNSTLCSWNNARELIGHTFGRQALPMVWDFAELAPFGEASGSLEGALDWTVGVAEAQAYSGQPAHVARGSATALPWSDGHFDSVITDPPYYDNVPYADISDFFYVWLRRTIGHLYPEHFASPGTPKKQEAVADATRHGGSKEKARQAYEQMMAQSFAEAHRVLKPAGELVIVYAHKTTLGWATLVDALRRAGFMVTEAWPLDTEMKSRLRGMDSSALASSIFLVARKREGCSADFQSAVSRISNPPAPPDAHAANTADAPPTGSRRYSRLETCATPVRPPVTGQFEAVRADLEQIVRERVETLWEMGISGADLVIACVGAGLRAFTRFARVEHANGEEVPAERFLSEVETVVLETILERLSEDAATKEHKEHKKEGGSMRSLRSFVAKTSLSGLDAATRFYVLWRYTYGAVELDAGEAIIFANGTHVELDGPHGLATGADALLEHRPPKVPEFLTDCGANAEQLRLVAQALAGPALKGGELAEVSPNAEQAALGKLLTNWQSVVECRAVVADRQKGQERLL